MPGIYLYAEVLQHIKQINLYAELETHKNESTKINISSDKQYITVQHDGQEARLLLPLQVSGSAEVTIPAQRAKDISVRLELEDTDAVEPRSQDPGPDAPWFAENLNSETRLRCLGCGTVITEKSTSFTWKDLPSENWAEMMDFWHCHKPHDDDIQEHETDRNKHTANTKGYGIDSHVRASKNTVFIDSSTFLLAADDCGGAHVGLPQLKSNTNQFGHERKQQERSAWQKYHVLATDTNVLEQAIIEISVVHCSVIFDQPWRIDGRPAMISALLVSLIFTVAYTSHDLCGIEARNIQADE